MPTVAAPSSPPVVRRAFLQVGARRVHYRRCGDGPPALLIHSSPTNSSMVLPEMLYLARSHTCFAFDTPGFGLSQPLALDSMQVADLADAIAANMEALGLPACPVYGCHTGSAIALELALRHPHLVTGIALDGLAMYTDAECAAMLDASAVRAAGNTVLQGYFEPFPVDELGGHFNRIWTRFRDQTMWFPWFDRRPANLNAYDLSAPAKIHQWTMMYFYAAKHYVPAYRAAMTFGGRAPLALASLRAPALITASDTDMLLPHLERIPPLPAGQCVERFGSSAGDNKHALVARHFARFGSPGLAPEPARTLPSGSQVGRQFVDMAHGQVHVRHAGQRTAPALLLLHDAPGSAQALEALMLTLGQHYFVLAPDLPGCGESPPLAAEAPPLDAYARLLVALCEQLGLARPLVYGVGFGSSLALAMQQQPGAPVRALVLRGLLLPDPDQRREMQVNYAPVIELGADGGHWYRTWLMLRDSQSYWPWYDRRYAATRKVAADTSAQTMHDWTFEVMKQHASYQHLIVAALFHDARAALAQVRVPLVLCADPALPLSAYDALAAGCAPGAGQIAPGHTAAALAAALPGA